MSHTLANLEYHHFKYDAFRRPGDIHVHYFGTGTLSIADGIKTENGDEFEIDVPVFGKPLRNRLKIVADRYKPSGTEGAVTPAFIGLDWGTTTLRAYLAAQDGSVIEARQSADGILAAAGRFEDVFATSVEGWPSDLPIIASGMIGSRQGWIEAPYCACPAGLAEIAGALVIADDEHGPKDRLCARPFLHRCEWRSRCHSRRGDASTGRALSTENGAYLLPGTHSKWLAVKSGRIDRFATYMTGEVYAVLKAHTILGRLMSGEGDDAEAFSAGVKRGAAAPELLLHTIFGTRTLGLFGTLEPDRTCRPISQVFSSAARLQRRRANLGRRKA